VCLAGEAGFRSGEIKALRWREHVDLVSKMLQVKQQTCYGGVTACADDNEIRSGLDCCVGDHVRCVRSRARHEPEARVEPVGPQLLDLCFDLRLDLVLICEHRMTARAAEEQLLAVNDDQSTVGATGQLLRVRQGTIRGL